MNLIKLMIILTITIISLCKILEANEFNWNCNCIKISVQKRKLLLFGNPRNLTIYYGPRAPNRASAAMLFLVLKYITGYDNIMLKEGPRTLCELVTNARPLTSNDKDYDELIIHLGAEYTEDDDRRHCDAMKNCDDFKQECTAAGTRFNVMVPPVAPMTLFLQAKLSVKASNDLDCTHLNSWIFYKDKKNVENCGFKTLLDENFDKRPLQRLLLNPICVKAEDCYPIFIQDEKEYIIKMVNELSLRIQQQELHLQMIFIPESDLRNMITNSESSILFLDYDLWAENPQHRVHLVQPPPCAKATCHHEFNKTEAYVVGDAEILYKRARLIFDTITTFSISSKDTLEILQSEAKGKHLIDAACDQVCNDNKNKTFSKWVTTHNLRERYLWIYVILCNDPDSEEYNRMIREIFVKYQKLEQEKYAVQYAVKNIDCNNLHNLVKNMMFMFCSNGYERMSGIVGAGAGAAAAAYNARMMETQLVLYDTPPDNTKLNEAARTVASDLKSLAHVTQHFIKSKGWKRIAVISDSNQMSTDFLKLIRQSDLIIGQHTLKDLNQDNVNDILKKFDEERAKIFLINTNSEVASKILCAVFELGLGSSNYVWIVREWRELTCDLGSLKYYTISYWWRGGKFPDLPGVGGNAKVRQWLDELWPDRPWPRLAAPLFDSLILLSAATTAAINRDYSIRYDLHGHEASKLVTESLKNTTVMGVVQKLNPQRNYKVEEPLVFIDEWQNTTRYPVAVWRINSTSMTIEELKTLKQISVTNTDGRYTCCFVDPDNEFNAKCKDWPIWMALIVIALIPFVAYMARRWRLIHLATIEREIHVKLLARSERTAKVLAPHLVPRSALDSSNTEVLGKGHYGLVNSARVKIKGTFVNVAVKELQNDAAPAEEALFLREGCVMAALSHPNIVKLIGVCAADGPPLLLMEYAFFKDLRKYLRDRRLLIDVPREHDLANEAAYVSPLELTRLAREAATALEYLSEKKYVHRDLRSANCVVTQDRTLKLADFGLARSTDKHETGTGTDDYMYVCRSHGMFPIMTMAPENINYGEYTTASDVWSLGILILEIATLGAYPYGNWSHNEIFHHLKANGHPPFPEDISNETLKILSMCWRSSPSSRPSSATVKQYLSDNPTAITPAHPSDAYNHHCEKDSGFRESM